MKKNIYLMYLIGMLQGMVFYGPVSTLYRQAQGVSIFQITLIESISLILCLILEIPWGIIADKIGYKRTMIFCNVLYFISKVVFWQASGFLWFLIERILLSITFAGLSGVDESILYLSSKKGESHKIFGIYNSLQTIGLLFSAFIFSVIVKNNYRLAAVFTVISYGIAAVLSFFLCEVRDNTQRSHGLKDLKRILKETLRNPKLLTFIIAVAFLSETHQTITVFLNQLQYIRCGMSSALIGYVYIVVTCIGLCGFASAFLTKKIGMKMTGIILYSIAILSCLTLSFTFNAGISIGSVLALEIVNNLFQPFQAEYQNRQIQTTSRATALSVNAMIIDSIGAGTNLIFGRLSDANLTGAFLFGAFLCIAGLLLFFYSIMYKERKE